MTRAITHYFASAVASLGLLGAMTAHAGHAPTITGIVVQSGGEFDRDRNDFDILLNAVLAADLAGALDDPDADLTVYAPTDAAFIRLAKDLGFSGRDEAQAFEFIVAALTELGGGDPIPVLTNVLLYHVSPGAKTASETSQTPIVQTLLEGATLLPRRRQLIDNDPDIRDARLSGKTDGIRAENGVINPISRVLIPLDIANTNAAELPTIAGLVAASGGSFDHNSKDFDLLLTALQAADLVGAVADIDADLTVLAPNDQAFIRLARDLGYRGRDEGEAFNVIVGALTQLGDGDPIPLLQAVLLYHVLPAGIPVKDVLTAESLQTLAGATITPDVATRTLIDNDPRLRDPRVSLLSKNNFRAANGFVTTISRVLIPVDLSTL
ncbi:MAG: fasciclin domain-containing protein [Pseudomonadota bacterium]